MEIDARECAAVKFTRLIPGVVTLRTSEPQQPQQPPPTWDGGTLESFSLCSVAVSIL